MTDYTKPSGTGYILIRDTGLLVQYYFKAGYTSDHYNGLPFSITVNGVTLTRSINYTTGAAQVLVYSTDVNHTEGTTFSMTANTSIAGIGGPSTLSVTIVRAVPPPPPPLPPTLPQAPATPQVLAVSVNSVTVYTTPNGDGGSAIINYEVGWGTDSSGPTNIIFGASNNTQVRFLATGVTYFFWYRAINAVGASPWSGAVSARTYIGAYVNDAGIWRIAIPYVKVAGVWKQAEPIVKHS